MPRLHPLGHLWVSARRDVPQGTCRALVVRLVKVRRREFGARTLSLLHSSTMVKDTKPLHHDTVTPTRPDAKQPWCGARIVHKKCARHRFGAVRTSRDGHGRSSPMA